MATTTVTIVAVELSALDRAERSAADAPTAAIAASHLALVRDTVEVHGGEEAFVDGTSLVAAFPSARNGIDAAVAVQRRVERRNRQGGAPVGVRVGVALGDAEVDGTTWSGEPIVEALACRDAAWPGQIIVSELVRLHAQRSAREHAVSRLERPERTGDAVLYELHWVGTDADELRVPLPARLDVIDATAVVGRHEERARLRSAYKTAAGGEGRQVALISGEAGMGKTTLAAVEARRAFEQGALVLYGRCDSGVGIPYQPFAEALAHYAVHASPRVLDTIDPVDLEQLAALVPALGPLSRRSAAAVPSDDDEPTTLAASDADTQRYVLFRAVVSLLVRASADDPVVLVLDDLHSADATTVALLRHLIGATEASRVVIIGTFRGGEVAADHPLGELLAALHTAPSIERLELEGLDVAETVALMEAAAGHEVGDDGESLALALQRETAGNPFFTSEMLRHLAESGLIVQDADGRWTASTELAAAGLPQSVREVIGHRVARLGRDVEQLLRQAAVIGREFDVELLAAITDRSASTVLDDLDEATAAALVTEARDRPGCFSFTHALAQHALYDDLGPTRRQLAHRRVAAALEELSGGTGVPVLEIAHHAVLGMRPSEADAVIAQVVRAGDYASSALAPDEAARWFAAALELHDRHAPGDGRRRAELLVRLGAAQRDAGDGTYRTTLLEAAAAARGVGDDHLLVEAALANTRGFFSAAGIVDAERVAVLEAAVGVVGPEPTAPRAMLLAVLADELVYAGDYPRRRALADEALGIARQLEDPRTLVAVLNHRWAVLNVPENVELQLAETAEALALAGELGDPVLEFWAAVYRTVVATQAGELTAAAEAMAIEEAIAAAVPQPTLRWTAGWIRGNRSYVDGDLDRADLECAEAVGVGIESGQPDAMAIYSGELLAIRRAQGRFEEIVALVEQATVDNPGIPSFRAALAAGYCDLGRDDDARAVIAADAAGGFDYPYEVVWLFAVLTAAEVVAHLGLVDAAEVLIERLAPFRGLVEYLGTTSAGAVDHYLGLLCVAAGRPAADVDDAFARALATHEAMGAAYFTARTQAAWAQALGSRPDAESQARATELATAALESANQHGYRHLAATLEAAAASD